MRERKKDEIIKSELKFFKSLSEKDKRRYSALEALKSGIHGVKEVSERLKIHSHTIRDGIKELDNSEEQDISRIRGDGGGRKKK